MPVAPCAGAHDRIRTGDLFLTKEVLYRLSYMGPVTPSVHSMSRPRPTWSGKRDSNPRPSAWKADALPTELFPPWILVRFPLHASWWRGKDSNLRRHKPADLQSAPFVHSGTSPRSPARLDRLPKTLRPLSGSAPSAGSPMELAKGFEPPTRGLQNRCSTPELRQQA